MIKPRIRLLPFLLCLLIALAGCGKQSAPTDTRLSSAERKGQAYDYYQRLSETEQDAYSKIYRQIRSHPERIEIPPLDQQALTQVFQALSYDNPEILCMKGTCQLATQGGKSYFVPSYHCGVKECSQTTQALLETARRICAAVEGKSDYEKELYFHDYLVEHCSYQEDPDDWQAYTAAGALLNGTAVCEGYSRAFQLLLNQEGVENCLITGSARDRDGRVDGHMWNLVTLGGERYHVDVTWDDPVGSDQLAPSHIYFNLTDQMISANHLTFEPETPGCQATAENYFVKNGLSFAQYGEQARSAIAEAISQSVSRGLWSLEFRFDSREEYERAIDDLFAGERIYRLLERANLSAGQRIQTGKVQYHGSDEMLAVNLTVEKG